jgi:hypothetical protein
MKYFITQNTPPQPICADYGRRYPKKTGFRVGATLAVAQNKRAGTRPAPTLIHQFTRLHVSFDRTFDFLKYRTEFSRIAAKTNAHGFESRNLI